MKGPSPQGRTRQPQCATPLNIIFCAAEVAPWSKTGGLGDVMGALPQALAARGHRVMVVTARHTNGGADLKRYKGLQEALPVAGASPGRVRLQLANGSHEVAFFHGRSEGVDWVFVDHPVFQRPGTPYGDAGGAFEDNLFRFALLSLAALEAPLLLGLGEGGRPYGQDITFVANDWHASLLPVLLKARFQPTGTYTGAKCVLAIHNLAHQGVYPTNAFGALGLPGGAYGLLEWRPPATATEASPQATLNVLKGGIAAADGLVTVSQGYAAEICGTPQEQGVEALLAQRRKALRGIVNGIDPAEWDPSADPHLAARFSAADMAGKAACKRALQREMRLEPDPRAPLIGFVGRLDYQKGPDLVLDALPAIAALGCQVVMLGSGAADYEEAVQAAVRQYGFFFRAHVGFSVPLAHRLIAGCDMLLMPSRFEPCGLNQLYAMRYGTVPIAHATGGLADTIDDANAFGADEGTGWTFAPATVDALVDAVGAAVRCYRGSPAAWAALVARGMARDSGWDGAAAKYEKVLLGLRPPLVAPAGAAATAAA